MRSEGRRFRHKAERRLGCQLMRELSPQTIRGPSKILIPSSGFERGFDAHYAREIDRFAQSGEPLRTYLSPYARFAPASFSSLASDTP